MTGIRQVLQEMCSALPEDKRGSVLDDIRKISKERRRRRWQRTDVSPRITTRPSAATSDDAPTGVYRSTSELSAVSATCGDETAASRDFLWTGDTFRDNLMATVRTARRKQSVSATVVYNPAFYDAPVPYVSSSNRSAAANPARQPYLRMTPDNGFSLHQQQQRRQSDACTDRPTTQL